jgi:alpha-beta hydrolase superfamily lysophospholipase
MNTTTSSDGTAIAYDRFGGGPPVIMAAGAFNTRSTTEPLAQALAPRFSVLNYDRRGRGDSGDTQPYAVERELEDLTALLEIFGGSAMVFGGSSGAGLALQAAPRNRAISKLAVWEPPYHVDDSAPRLSHDFAARLDALVRNGRRAAAVELFMMEAAEATVEALAAMRLQPSWPEAEAVAHTLAYEAAVMGPGNALPANRLAAITQPTLVLTGGNSPAWITNAGKAVAGTIPAAAHRVLEGQTHNVSPKALAPELLEFFTT